MPCTTCKASPDGVALSRCSGCGVACYCSRDCQKKDWKSHKEVCAKSYKLTGGGEPLPPKGLTQKICRTFSRLMCNRFLWDLPEHDVYTLIIDAYRLRMDDFPRFDNVSQMRAVIYGGQDLDARGGLERFIHLAGKRPGILPPWWDSSKEEMCLKLAMGGITEDELPGLPKNTRKWLNMSKRPTVDKAELISHYGDSYFPMKLRLLTDVIYSCSLGNNDGTPLKRMRAQLEQKEDSDQAIWDTIIDARTGEMTSKNHSNGTFH